MREEWLDRPGPVRPGEELPVERLTAYLREHLDLHLDPYPYPSLDLGLDLYSPIAIEQFPSGHSNLTYLLRVGDRELVLRRPPFGAEKIKRGHDMEREYRILSGLSQVYAKVPRPLLFCDDASVIGAPFYIMKRVCGIILRKEPQSGLELSPQRMRALSEAFIDNLAEIHGLDVEAAGLSQLGRPEGYVRRQIEGWTERYQSAKTDEISEMERVARWLHKHMPEESKARATLIHNDYKYDNLILNPDSFEIEAVLDWEMATVGDPLMDLGTTLGYWIEPDDPEELQSIRFCLTTLPGNLTRADLVERYGEKSGHDVSNVLFYYVYALFKIAVIAQQIYYRYVQGYSKDERFAAMIHGVRALAMVAARVIEKGRIYR
jgi:aminoglycoside phosphotransferase (APT) family kinase protein